MKNKDVILLEQAYSAIIEHHDGQMAPEALDMTVGDFLDLLARDHTARDLYATIEQYIVDNVEASSAFERE